MGEEPDHVLQAAGRTLRKKIGWNLFRIRVSLFFNFFKIFE